MSKEEIETNTARRQAPRRIALLDGVWIYRRTTYMLGICALVALTGCATTNNVKQIDRLGGVGRTPKILVMTPDVKYYLLTAGGVTEPHAEWTETARRNFSGSLRAYANEQNFRLIESEEGERGESEVAYRKLYSAVGASILDHHFGPRKLPTKQGTFDWSLGPGIEEIADKYDADYALFSYYRDYQASGGRVALALVAAVAGIVVSTGGEGGFASLVDLETGDIIWFNKVEAGVGELRDEQNARATIDILFDNFPAS